MGGCGKTGRRSEVLGLVRRLGIDPTAANPVTDRDGYDGESTGRLELVMEFQKDRALNKKEKKKGVEVRLKTTRLDDRAGADG